MLFSVIIPVYNRPIEVDELLESLVSQTRKNFEVVIVEDGSSETSEHIVLKYSELLNISYFYKLNSGPGLTRNYGATKSVGEYLIFLDSDCVLPIGYIEEVSNQLESKCVDSFGGADRASDSFTNIQKAINYSMTSFFTTGGIRGGKRKMDKFYPRSFNMGVKKSVFDVLKGFSTMRFGEDIDFSTRIYENGFSADLFIDAWVYHKRRTDFKKFFKQVYNSGVARILMLKKRPESFKIVYALPAIFTMGNICILLGSILLPALLYLLVFFCSIIFIDSTIRNRSLFVGVLSVCATYVQLLGYGMGFLIALWKIFFLGHKKYSAFEKNFYN